MDFLSGVGGLSERDQPPVADFSASATSGIGLNQEVTFTDASTENPTSWLWTFSPSTVTYVTGTSNEQVAVGHV